VRVKFSDIFEIRNGSITPRVVVRIGGVQMGPGVSFGTGVSFGGLDLASVAGRDLEVDQNTNGVVIIKGVYDHG
jgi:hypothetical protein